MPQWWAINTALDDGVLTVRLDRPDAANARNLQMRDELAACWRDVASAPEVRAVILTASGGRHFCAGMDLTEASSPLDVATRLRGSRDIDLLAGLPQPTIAAINGAALGGGLEMALACDLRICSDQASVGLPEVTHGLIPGAGGTQRLPRLIGYARACELLLTGRRLGATEALDWGIVSRVVSATDLLVAAAALAAQIVANPEPAVRIAKGLLRESQDTPLDHGLKAELEALITLMASSARFGSGSPDGAAGR